MRETEEQGKREGAKIRVGTRVGHLTVVSDSGERRNGYIVRNCACDCGGQIRLDMRTLKRGTVRDCGCRTRVKPGQRDITGVRFGKLTARYCTGRKSKEGSYIWHLTCDCGGEVDASLHQLTTGCRKSCGCLSHPPRKDFIGKRFGRLTVIGYAGKRDGMHRWRCRCDCGRETTVGQTLLQSGKTKSCGCYQSEVCRENLKLVAGTSVTIPESRQGRLNANNTSGHTGVYRDARSGKWEAQIGFRGKNKSLGEYRNKEEAVQARARGEEMHRDFLDWYYGETLPGCETAGKTEQEREEQRI